MNTDEVIRTTMSNIAQEHRVLRQNGGLGFCTLASVFLHEALRTRGIQSTLVNVFGLNNKRMVESLRRNLYLLEPDTHIAIKNVAAHFKRNEIDPTKLGHSVVVVGDKVYDITAPQFGSRRIYNLTNLLSYWNDVYLDKSDDILRDFDHSSVEHYLGN